MVIQTVAEDEREAYIRDVSILCSDRLLELHVLPTEKCNFRCVYCYEDFVQGKMPHDIQVGLKRLISRRAQSLDLLNVSWFGGEPLVAKEIVLDVSRHAVSTCLASNTVFKGSMTTNGWFLDETTLEDLVSCGVSSFQITLDGPKDVHDTTRIGPANTGSYERIWQNLLAAKSSQLNFSIMLRLHIRPSTYQYIYDWLPHLQSALLDDSRFSLLVKPIEHLGSANDAQIDVFTNDLDRERAVSLFYQSVGTSSAFRTDIIGKACYAGRPNAWVIRSDGRLARCTVALYDDKNTVGRLTVEGDFEIDHTRLAPWFVGLTNLSPSVLGCPAQFVP